MKKKLRLFTVAFGLSFILLTVLSFYSLRQFTALTKFSDKVDNIHQVISQLYALESNLKDIDLNERGYLITRDSSYLHALLTKYQQIIQETETLRSRFAQDKEQATRLTLLRIGVYQRVDAIKENLTRYHPSSKPYIRRVSTGLGKCPERISRLSQKYVR
jgi:CHASE3 domain sensor protein